MIVMKKAISRRTMLRGLGATVALPLLESMVPAFTPLGQTAAAPVTRFGAVYVPNGVIPGKWFPTAEGSGFEFSPSLEPIAAFRNKLLVLSGLDSTPPPPPRAPSAVHGRASTKFLTDVFPDRVLVAGQSMDQMIARVSGKSTPLPSLELALESVDSGA